MKKKLLIDCTFISTTKLNTGIQRVVRNIVKNIYSVTNTSDYEAILVTLNDNKIKEISLDNKRPSKNRKIDIKKDDILLLIDSTWHLDIWESVEFAKLNKAMVVAVIYDIIPISHPQFCDATLVKYFKNWLNVAASYCDGFISISDTVNKELQSFFQKEYPDYDIENKLFDFFWLGADFKINSNSVRNVNKDLIGLYNTNDNIYLIVCTIEPRKNHKYLLDVFDVLWEMNYDVSLNIVGKVGWQVDDLMNRIHNHSQFNKKLFHWSNLNDDELNYCYKNSKLLLFSSYVEGFGLPIIESLFHNLPVLASDTPIHKEVGNDNIAYFDLNETKCLVSKIEDIEKNGIEKYNKFKNNNYKHLNWQDSTNILFEKILLFNSQFKPNLNKFIKIKYKKDKLSFIKHRIKNIPILGSILKKLFYSLKKENIKKVPIVGLFIRWVYNLLRLNNLKFTVFAQQQQINDLYLNFNLCQEKIKTLEEDVNKLESKNQKLNIIIENQEKNIKNNFSVWAHKYTIQEIQKQSILFNRKINHFIKSLDDKSLNIKDLKRKSQVDLIDDYYLAFENTFRGSREYIINRYTPYLEYIDSTTKVSLDIGCGRAEWVELLQKNNIYAQGIDKNFPMLNLAKEVGVKNLYHEEAIKYLSSCEDNSFDLVTAFHIIEHIPYEELVTLLLEIKRILKPNAQIFLETPNPLNIQVSSYEFYKDPTHLNPLPSDIVKFLLEFLGFDEIQVNYLHPLEKDEHLSSNSHEAQDYLIIAKNIK